MQSNEGSFVLTSNRKIEHNYKTFDIFVRDLGDSKYIVSISPKTFRSSNYFGVHRPVIYNTKS